MEERIIISLTTYSKRIGNIPIVLETIFKQTVPPDFIVINLAYNEVVPAEVQQFIDSHPIEVNWVPDKKVFKKLIPTLKKYPNDVVISIDDDWLYPMGMIEDFLTVHMKYPDFPISGNRSVFCSMQCHCGCASLQKRSFLGDYIDLIDDDLISHCPSDDMAYTFISNLARHPYLRTQAQYFHNMEPYNATNGYSEMISDHAIIQSYIYLYNRFGHINGVDSYMNDDFGISLVNDIIEKSNQKYLDNKMLLDSILHSKSYILGRRILRPYHYYQKVKGFFK